MNFITLDPKDYNLHTLTKLRNTEISSYLKSALNFMILWLDGKTLFQFETTGSTGKPKMIVHHREKMHYSAQTTLTALEITSNEVAYCCIDIKYIGGAMMLVRALINKMPLIIAEPSRNPLSINIPSFDFAAMVPLQLMAIVAENKSNEIKYINSCKRIILGGAKANTSLLTWIENSKCRFFETYGMTETVSHIALKHLNGANKSSYFKKVGDVKLDISISGTLRLMGTITDHQWLETNDMVELISDSEFHWFGRSDNVINTGGIKVQPEQIESEIAPILQEFNISNYAIIGLPDPIFENSVHLVIEGNNYNEKEILTIIKEKLDAEMRKKAPKSIIPLQNFPDHINNKINRRALIKLVLTLNIKPQ